MNTGMASATSQRAMPTRGLLKKSPPLLTLAGPSARRPARHPACYNHLSNQSSVRRTYSSSATSSDWRCSAPGTNHRAVRSGCSRVSDQIVDLLALPRWYMAVGRAVDQQDRHPGPVGLQRRIQLAVAQPLDDRADRGIERRLHCARINAVRPSRPGCRAPSRRIRRRRAHGQRQADRAAERVAPKAGPELLVLIAQPARPEGSIRDGQHARGIPRAARLAMRPGVEQEKVVPPSQAGLHQRPGTERRRAARPTARARPSAETAHAGQAARRRS